MNVTPAWYMTLGAVLFVIGMVGILVRRNALVMFMSIELMLNAVNLSFVAAGRRLGLLEGQISVLFALGVAGFLFRKNIITVFMSIELMLNAVNLSFVTFSYQFKQVDGHIFSFFVMVVAAAEAAVGLGIILTVFKNRSTLHIDEVSSLKN